LFVNFSWECGWSARRYHLRDVVTGKIYFLLVRIRIKHMELAILRRESAGTGKENHCTQDGGTNVSLFPFSVLCSELVLPLASFLATSLPTASNVYHETDTLTKFEVSS
jgi:vacuolar protein sorting-associated protein 26